MLFGSLKMCLVHDSWFSRVCLLSSLYILSFCSEITSLDLSYMNSVYGSCSIRVRWVSCPICYTLLRWRHTTWIVWTFVYAYVGENYMELTVSLDVVKYQRYIIWSIILLTIIANLLLPWNVSFSVSDFSYDHCLFFVRSRGILPRKLSEAGTRWRLWSRSAGASARLYKQQLQSVPVLRIWFRGIESNPCYCSSSLYVCGPVILRTCLDIVACGKEAFWWGYLFSTKLPL